MDKELIKEMRIAIKTNDLDKVKKLVIRDDFNINEITVFGTFLHDATSFGKYDIAKYLIDCGINVNINAGIRDSNALTCAAFEGNMKILKLLYDNEAIIDSSTFERNPLFAAIYNGHLDVVKFLVDKGINLDVQYAVGDFDAIDAYEYARQYGRTEIANYLKEKMGDELL